MTIKCAAVIGQANNPLYLEAFDVNSEEETLQFHHIVHCSLDAVEGKFSAPQKNSGDSTDSYLGMLYPTEDHKVFGYVSNTKIKFMLVLSEPIPKDDELRMIFRRFHAAYVDAVSNPFYTINTAIPSKSFDASVRTIITTV